MMKRVMTNRTTAFLVRCSQHESLICGACVGHHRLLASDGLDVSNVTLISEVPYNGTSTASAPLSRSPLIEVPIRAALYTRQYVHVYVA
jgi:hypothetical protein